MENKLVFKLIDGVPFVPEQGYNDQHPDILGQERLIKFSDAVEAGWQENTSIENVFKYGKLTGRDYRWIREVIASLVVDFNTLTEPEKVIVANNLAVFNGTDIDYQSIVIYYIMQGMSQEAATMKVIDTETDFMRPEISRCSNQRYILAQKVCALFLSMADQDDIYERTDKHVRDFKMIGLLGTNYRSTLTGIMDFVESTGIYAASDGLASLGYVLPAGKTTQNFIDSLKNALYLGKLKIE